MASPIRRIVEIILDRNAARRTEQESKRTLSGIDRAFGRVRSAALALGGAIAGALAVRRIARFGREAVRTANEANGIWNRLAGTINNAGGNFEEMEPRIRMVARAMQDATTIGDEAFASTLQSLINISQDVEGSMNNVGIAMDLAAGAGISLETSALLVGRAMVGQTSLLSRYGIVVEEGADAIEVLRNQFQGMAVNEAATLEGQVIQLNNEWADFKEAVGNAIIEAGSGASVIDTLTEVVKEATIWVDNNRQAFTTLGNILAGTIRTLGLVFDGYVRLARFLASGFTFAFSGILRLIASVNDGLALAADAGERLNRVFGRTEQADSWAQTAEMLRERAEGLKEAADAARDASAELFDEAVAPRPTTPSGRQGSEGISPSIDPRLREENDTMSAEARQALEDLEKEADRITESVRTPLEVYRDTLAELRSHRDADRVSQETYTRAVAEARDTYFEAVEALNSEVDELSRVDEALQEHQQNLEATRMLTSVLGDEVNLLEEEEKSLISTLQILAEEGVPATDERFQELTSRLSEVRAGLRLTSSEMEQTAAIASAAGELVGAAFGAGIGPLAEGKAKQNAVLAAEELAHGFAALSNPFTAATAGAHFAAAAKYSAVAISWKALAGVAGGGPSVGGGGGARTPGSSGVISDLGGPGSESISPETEVHIHFVGEGFQAVNPEVQRVVRGASQLAEERFGPNTRVRVHDRGSS